MTVIEISSSMEIVNEYNLKKKQQWGGNVMFLANIVRSKTVDPLKVDDSVKINAEKYFKILDKFF